MIECRQDYRRYVTEDRRATGRQRFSWLSFLDPVWAYQRTLRKAEYVTNCKRSWPWAFYKWYLKLRLRRLGMLTGLEIPLNVVGPGLRIPHAGTIVISRHARLGSFVTIGVDVVVGENRGPENVPVIGDHVIIEPGAKLFGRIRIADFVHIGANAVVNRSVEEPAVIVAGVPARKVGVRLDVTFPDLEHREPAAPG